MKTLSTILLILCLAHSMSSQNKIEKIGPKVDTKEAEYFKRMAGDDANFFYTLRYNTEGRGQNYFIEKYSKSDLSLVKSIHIGSVLFETSYLKNGKYYLFSRKINNAENNIQYLLNVFDLSSGAQVEKDKVIAEVYYDKVHYNDVQFIPCFSPDDTKLGIVSKNISQEKVEETYFDLYEFDSFKKTGSKKLPNQFENTLMKAYSYKMDNHGDLVFFFRYNMDDKQESARGGGLGKYSFSTGNLVSYKMKLKSNVSLYSTSYKADSKNGKIYIYSMARENGGNEQQFNEGFYIAKLDANTLVMETEKVSFFDKGILSQLTCNGNPKIKMSEAYNASIDIISDAEFFISADRREYGIFDGKNFEDAYEIVVCKVTSATLNPVWMKMIPRSTSFIHSMALEKENSAQTMYVTTESKLSFVFIEHPKFEDKKVDFKTATLCDIPNISAFNKTNCVAYSIDSNGNFTKDIVYVNDDNCVVPNYSVIKAGENKYIMRFCKDRKESFGILNLK